MRAHESGAEVNQLLLMLFLNLASGDFPAIGCRQHEEEVLIIDLINTHLMASDGALECLKNPRLDGVDWLDLGGVGCEGIEIGDTAGGLVNPFVLQKDWGSKRGLNGLFEPLRVTELSGLERSCAAEARGPGPEPQMFPESMSQRRSKPGQSSYPETSR